MDFSHLCAHLDLVKEFDIPEYDLLVKKDRKTVFRATFGHADAQKTIPVRENSLRWLFSLSKVVTATMGMRLVERGELSLDDEVAKFIPAFADMTVKQGDATSPAKNKMLVRHLFTMQAGLNYSLHTPSLMKCRENKSASTYDIACALAETPLDFEPGTDTQYSFAHDVLAAVCEVATGRRWSHLLCDEIFDPLGLRDIGFHPTDEQRSRFTCQYNYNTGDFRSKALREHINMYILSDEHESGGAGLFASTDDYSAVVDALANDGVAANGYRLLKPETIALMRTNQVPGDAEFYRRGYGYGFGVRMLLDRDKARTLTGDTEFGWEGAASSYVLIDPENHLSVVFATHVFVGDLLNHALVPMAMDRIYEALGIATCFDDKRKCGHDKITINQ